MRKVFINCGAHYGADIINYRKHYDDFEYFAFECFPACLEELRKLDDVTVIDKAVYTEDTTLHFRVGVHDVSGSLRRDKKKFMTEEEIEVEAIDFSKWLETNFSKEDYIVVSMDIEGTEYDVVPHLFKTKSIKYIDELYLETHHPRVHVDKDIHDAVVNKVKKHFGSKAYIEFLHNHKQFEKINKGENT